MRAYVGNTDFDWYQFLRAEPALDEVNFWFPKPTALLRTGIQPVMPFLFKLKANHGHRICGFAFLVDSVKMPAWYAWETFGRKNGSAAEHTFLKRIGHYRRHRGPLNELRRVDIGCLLLSEPTFFPPEEWVAAPEDWKRNIVRGRYYDTAEGVGARLWRDCLARRTVEPVASESGPMLFGKPQLVRPRLGQGAFKVAVTRAYDGACGITREHSLPVLDAAHIRPVAATGTHAVSNGIALRADLHRLFDSGYITFDRKHQLVVSRRLREDYDNGLHYYGMQERRARLYEPKVAAARPDPEALAWHREQVFLG